MALLVVVVIRAVGGLVGLVGGIGLVGGCVGTSSRVHEVFVLLSSPISAIDFQCEVLKLGKGFEAREIQETILYAFGQSLVSRVSKGSVVPLGTSGSSGKVNEVVGSSMMILHDYFFELYFCLCSIVEWCKVHFKLGMEIFPILESGRLGVDLAEDSGLPGCEWKLGQSL